MNARSSRVIVAQMTAREYPSWTPEHKHQSNRLLRNTSFFAAGFLCLGVCAWLASDRPEKAEAVMSHLTTGFEYDETLGRLQLVSSMLPESAMVFLTTEEEGVFCHPMDGEVAHTWSQQEPWIEYASASEVSACADGEVMTVVRNHSGMHTIRIRHENGYESIYSGLTNVCTAEHDVVQSGQILGESEEMTAFELRKDGVSILPAFSEF